MKPGEAVFDKAKVPEAPAFNIWRFNYKDGPAPLTGYVRATSEVKAYAVACKWCEVQGFRSPAKVFAWICADETILDK